MKINYNLVLCGYHVGVRRRLRIRSTLWPPNRTLRVSWATWHVCLLKPMEKVWKLLWLCTRRQLQEKVITPSLLGVWPQPHPSLSQIYFLQEQSAENYAEIEDNFGIFGNPHAKYRGYLSHFSEGVLNFYTKYGNLFVSSYPSQTWLLAPLSYSNLVDFSLCRKTTSLCWKGTPCDEKGCSWICNDVAKAN